MSAGESPNATSAADRAALLDRIGALEGRIEALCAALGRQIARSTDVGYAQVEALIGLYRELDGQAALPPMRRWAISPDAARQLRDLIVTRRPGLTIELGSGVSTLLVGMQLREAGEGSLVVFEHDPVFWAETYERVEAYGLDDIVTVRFAPLVPYRIDDEEFRWYDLAGVELDAPIDLVIVDGPPDGTGPQARFPALPLLRDRCSPGCLFFLDDYIRDAEQASAKRWIAEYGAELAAFSSATEKWTAVVALHSAEPESRHGGHRS